MPIYINSRAKGVVNSVEIEATPQGNIAYIMLDNANDPAGLREWLQSDIIHQQIITETTLKGNPLLITKGPLTPDAMIQQFAAHGEQLNPEVKEKKFDWWSMRGVLGVAGQTLQLTSATRQVEQLGESHAMLEAAHPKFSPALKPGMWVRKSFDPAVGMFAIFNLAANFGNMIYGGQKEDDKNRLHYLKSQLVEDLSPKFKPGEKVADVDQPSKMAQNRKEERTSPIQHVNDFLKRNSVRFFELGLRSVAALALVLPFQKKTLAAGGKLLMEGKPIEAFGAARNKNTLVLMGGLGYLSGKVIAWFSKVPDPYNPNPHTQKDTIQEKVLFPFGSVIETMAGLSIATGAFKDRKIALTGNVPAELKVTRDWLGGVGGLLFAGAYIIRMGAKFGSRNIDMKEVMAYSSDLIAKTPEDQRPAMTAHVASILTEHFSDKNVTYGKIYNQLNEAVHQYHPTHGQTPAQPPKEETAHEKELLKEETQSAPTTHIEPVSHEIPVTHEAVASRETHTEKHEKTPHNTIAADTSHITHVGRLEHHTEHAADQQLTRASA